MSVRSALTTSGKHATPDTMGFTAARGMSYADAAVVAVLAGTVVVLAMLDPKEALCFLLAVPIWIVSRDLGLRVGTIAALLGLLFVGVLEMATDVTFGPLGFAARAIVFGGAAVAGGQARHPAEFVKAGGRQVAQLLTSRPEVTRSAEVLSHRELDVLEEIAMGTTNAGIAKRFVISENTVKSHVSQILKKLSAANRTEAAYRYIERYGRPAASNGDAAAAAATEATSQIRASSALTATVSELRRSNRLLLKLQDGRDVEAPVIAPIRPHLDVGASVIVYLDQHERAVGWYLPDKELGVDMRHWAP